MDLISASFRDNVSTAHVPLRQIARAIQSRMIRVLKPFAIRRLANAIEEKNVGIRTMLNVTLLVYAQMDYAVLFEF